jgi:hypothetical protein
LEGRRHSEDPVGSAALHWFPAAELYAIQRIEYLDDVLVLSGAGVGGGSHVYANTLYVPPKQFFDAREWAGITDWADELAPHIDQASRMLGVVRYPYMPTDVDRAIHEVAVEIGREETFNKAPVGVYFGTPGGRGRRSLLRRPRAAPHRLQLVRQLQQRLRPQRQEQADDELPLPGREARYAGPRAARGVRPRSARRKRIRGACAASRLAARGAPPPPHVHRRTGDRLRPCVWLGEAPASHAAQGPPDGVVQRARATCADELRTASLHHADPTASGSAIPTRSASCGAQAFETFTRRRASGASVKRPKGCSGADVREARKRARPGGRLLGCTHVTLTPGH